MTTAKIPPGNRAVTSTVLAAKKNEMLSQGGKLFWDCRLACGHYVIQAGKAAPASARCYHCKQK